MTTLARQVLFAAGGDVLSKYGTLVWRKTPPKQGGETPYTFTRTGTGLYLANDVAVGGLKVFTAAANTARIEQLVDPVTAQLQTYLKLEPAATNSCLQSQTLATAPWGGFAGTVTNNASTAPDGTTTATSLVPDVTSVVHSQLQIITITAGEFYAVSGFLKVKGYNFYRLKIDNGGAGIAAYGDLSLGTITGQQLGTGTLSGQAIIPLGNGYYWVGAWGKTGGAATTVTLNVMVFDTLAHAQNETAYAGDASSGLYAWGFQLERNSTAQLPPSSYIPTTTIAVTRNADSFLLPWFVPPQLGTWIYTRFIEKGAAWNGYEGTFTISPGGGPKFYFLSQTNNGLVGQYGGELWCSSAVGSIVAPAGNAMPAVGYGQVIELLAHVTGTLATPIVTLRQSINGGAETAATGTGNSLSLPLPMAWAAATIKSGAGAGAGGQNVSRQLVGFGAGSVVNTIADVRNIL